MAPTVRAGSVQTGSGAAVSSAAITKPVGLAVGDVIDLFIEIATANANTASMPTGWVQAHAGRTNDANANHMEHWYKVADAADVAASSYTCSFGANRTYAYVVCAIVGVNTASPMGIATINNDWTLSAQSSITIPAGTTSVNDCLVVGGVGATDTTTFSSSALTEIGQVSRTNAAAYTGYTTQAVTGSTGTKAATLGTARNCGYALIAYQPLPTQTINVPQITRTPQVLTPGLVPGTRGFAVPTITRTPTVYAPSLLTATNQTFNVPVIPRTPTVHEPSIDPGVFTFDVPKITRTPQVFAFSSAFTADVIAQEKKTLQRTLEGYAGPVQMRNRLLISDKFGNESQDLPDWDNAGVAMSNFTDATWELSFTARYSDDFDPETDYITAVTDVLVNGEWERFYLGQYRFLGRENTYSEELRAWSLTGHSVEDILLNDQPSTGYTVAAGAMCLVTVKALLVSLGFPATRIDLPTTDRAIPNGLYWHPAGTEEDTNWLRVVNSILNSCGYSSLRADNYGRLYAYDVPEDPTKLAPDVVYGPADMPETENFVGGTVTDNWDYERFANRIIAVSDDVNQDPPLVAVAENRNPNSRASIQRLGRTITKKVSTSTAASQATLDKMAKAQLITASGFYRRSTITTLRDPRRKPDETYEFIYKSEGETVMSDRWNVINWKYPLDRDMSPMTHEIAKVEAI